MSTTYDIRKDFFDERAEKWMDMFYKDESTGEYTKFDHKFKRLFDLIAIKNGNYILDVGCGSGILVPYILKRIGEKGRLHELDYSVNMIKVNKQIHNDQRIEFLNIDIIDINIGEAFYDIVICFSCFPHLDDKKTAMKVMSRILKTGGKLAVAHFDSSAEINSHHRKSSEVMHDQLPHKDCMKSLFDKNNLKINKFIDDDGFYLVLGEKSK